MHVAAGCLQRQGQIGGGPCLREAAHDGKAFVLFDGGLVEEEWRPGGDHCMERADPVLLAVEKSRWALQKSHLGLPPGPDVAQTRQPGVTGEDRHRQPFRGETGLGQAVGRRLDRRLQVECLDFNGQDAFMQSGQPEPGVIGRGQCCAG